MMRTLFGIKNCDSCRNARKWLDSHNIEYEFHDVREDSLDIQMLERWSARIDWRKLLNTRSTTWRQLPDKERDDMGKDKAMATMLKHPTLVKRPVLESEEFIAVGFKADNYQDFFHKTGLI